VKAILSIPQLQLLVETLRAAIGRPACLSSKPLDGFASDEITNVPNRFPGPLAGSAEHMIQRWFKDGSGSSPPNSRTV